MNWLHRHFPALVALALLLATIFAPIGATAAISGVADYRSSLTTGISSADSSLTVVSTSTPDGELLIPGLIYGLKLGGREYVIGTLNSGGKTFSSLIRGVSQINGTTTGGTAESWGRGTAVEITDAPSLLELINELAGRQFVPNALRYNGVTTGTLAANGSNLASVDYANSLSFGAVAQANETTAGFSQLATQIQAASSTSTGSTGARLVLGANLATSTFNTATAPLRVVVTKNSGKIDENFFPTTLANNYTFSGSATFNGSFSAGSLASTSVKFFNATSTTSTWTKQAGLKFVVIREVGGGGGSGGISGSSPNWYSTPGAGAGGYCYRIVPASALGATETVTVGAGGTAGASAAGTGGTGGTTSFGTWTVATGGTGSTGNNATAGVVDGGVGGTCTTGDIKVAGGQGFPGVSSGTTVATGYGMGGVSAFGGTQVGGAESAPGANQSYGNGAQGRSQTVTTNSAGLVGATGAVFVEEHY